MLHFANEAVTRENAYQINEIENRRLDQLQSQLESFNLQATLIVGFALATVNSGNLGMLADETSRFCVYKRPVVAHIYFLLASFSIATCMSCIGVSFFVIFRSQKAANEVSVRHTVSLIRRAKTSIMASYFVGMSAFFSSFILCTFMYFAYPNWTEVYRNFSDSEGARKICTSTSDPSCGYSITAAFDVPVIRANNGRWYATCLDPYNPADLQLQSDVGLSIALTSLITFLLTFLLGYRGLQKVRKDFRRMQDLVDAENRNRGSGSGASANAKDERDNVEMLSRGEPRRA